MATPVETLIDFIQRRRARLGLGHNALARASGIDAGTLANLTGGRVKHAPALPTLQKLAAGLRVDPNLLVRIASGMDVDLEAAVEDGLRPATVERVEVAGEAAAAAEGPLASTTGRFPLSIEEIGILMEAVRYGIFWRLEDDPGLLEIPPADRRWIFRDLEAVLATRKKFGPPRQ